MNTVYYGNHAYGVEAAARTYFSRSASKLSLLQSALLAGLPQAPSDYDPFDYPDRAIQRRNDVLEALYRNHDITYGNYQEASRQEAQAETRPDLHPDPRALLLRLRARRAREEVRRRRRFARAASRSTRRSIAACSGLRTTAVNDTLYYDTDPASAIVAIDPRNGAIKTMTAVTPGRTGNQFNLAAQARRQAGSTFKTYVLAEAIAEGVNPDTTSYVSAPLHYQPDPYSEAWDVSTYSHTYLGSTSITQRDAAPRTTPSSPGLTLDLGPEKVAAMAHRLGVRSTLKTKEGAYVPSLGLGSIGVSPLDMASAYATIAAGGIYSKPMAIRKVVLADGKDDKDSGWGKPDRQRVIEDWVAAEVTRILELNVQGGTGVGANIGRTGGRQDGNDREPRRRLVLRHHPDALGQRLGRLSAGRDPDDERPRHLRGGRHLPGHDLEALHGAGDQLDSGDATSRRRARSRSGTRSRAGSTPARSTSLRRIRRRLNRRRPRRSGEAGPASPRRHPNRRPRRRPNQSRCPAATA